ncbi:MAG: tRNA pseudouridine(55) synthase TruB [Bacilli bacterium]
MNGVLLINKPKGITSRDVVNKVSKILNIKKVGHSGTLDPMATGVLVLGIGKTTKIMDLLTSLNKEYIAEVTLGIETDTLDITGSVINEKKFDIKKEDIITVLKDFTGEYNMEVPIYSAIKVKGKKLYEYARNGKNVDLPIKKVNVYNLELISDLVDNKFKIKCKVSKGTYIRSLIRDIGRKLGTYATMSELERAMQGDFNIEDCFSIEDIEKGEYKLLSVKEVLNIPKIKVTEKLLFKIKNGAIIEKFFDENKALILDNNDNEVAIYQTYEKDNTKAKPYKMLK